MIIVFILLVIVESLLIIISNFIRIPQFSSILLAVLICLIYIIIFTRANISDCSRKVLAGIAIASISWSVFSAYALPYWNSIVIQDVIGNQYPATKSIDYMLSAKQAQEDFDYAVQCLEKVHPAILEDNKLSSYIQRSRLDCTDDSISVHNLYQHLQTIAASFHDAHTKVFPVWNSRHWIDYSLYGEIYSINGILKNDFEFTFGKFISSETTDWTRKKISGSFNSYEGLRLLGLFDSDTLKVEFINDDSTIVKQSFTKHDFKQKESYASFSLTSEEYAIFKYDDSISSGYLNLSNCFYYTLEQHLKFKNILKEFFAEVKSRQYEHIVIDLRNNPGGNASLANELFRYLPIDSLSLGARYHRFGPVMVGGKKKLHNAIYKDLCFNGEVYVLTSLDTFSGAMHITDYLQGNHLAKVVGESPGNTPTCYTDITHFVLPNSKLSLTISTGKFIRVEESCEANLIVPDIACKSETAYKTLKRMLLDARNDSKKL